MKAIYKRELAAYAHSMTGCVATAFLLAGVGLYFMAYNLYQGAPGFATALNAASFLLILVIPLLTMRSLAEERKNRTDQLLLTAPVSVTGVVLGKFAAMVTVFAVPCVLFCLCPLILKVASGSSGVVYFQSDYATILAFFLMGCLFLSIGLLLSALTESQVIAAGGTARGVPPLKEGGHRRSAHPALSVGRHRELPAHCRSRKSGGGAPLRRGIWVPDLPLDV